MPGHKFPYMASHMPYTTLEGFPGREVCSFTTLSADIGLLANLAH